MKLSHDTLTMINRTQGMRLIHLTLRHTIHTSQISCVGRQLLNELRADLTM